MIAWKPFGRDGNLASVRLRSVLPCQYLQRAGWPCEIFDETRVAQYRLVIFQKTYTADDLLLIARLREQGCRIVFDLCDNHFYRPAGALQNDERIDRLKRIIELADLV